MPQNFIESCREQGFLLPPDVRDWLAPDHLAWFVVGAVEEMDLAGFYSAYRADGHGGAAYELSMVVGLILYAFATGVRSSRGIERHCRENVAFRVITGNLVPDHVTVARFICRHQRALAGLFTEVLKLCDKAGLVKSGVVSVDGTRIAGNANPDVNFQFEQIALEVVAEVRSTDEAEDEEFGEARGDELPEQLRTPEGRREFFRQARRELGGAGQSEDPQQIGGAEAEASSEPRSTPGFEFDSSHITDAGGGRRRWLSEAKRQLEQHRWDDPDPISRSRIERLLLALERLEADLAAERAGNEAYEAYRCQGRMRDGRRFGRPPDPHLPPEVPEGKVNVTDPDSRPIPIGFGFVQGYNAQTAVNEQQIVLAAEISRPTSPSSGRWSTRRSTRWRRRVLISTPRRSPPTPAIGTSSRWTTSSTAGTSQCWSRPTRAAAAPQALANEPRANWMRTVLKSDNGRERYAKRKQTVQPLYGDTKHNKGFIRFHRRGRIKVRTEFRLLMMAHNLTKVHRRQIATVAA